jgi:gluconolactonase
MRRISCLTALWLLSAATASAADFPVPSTVANGAALVLVYENDRFFEGPTWDPRTKKLYFTAFGKDQETQILRLDGPNKVAVWLDKTEGVNGTYLSRDGRLLGAQAFGHRLLSYGIGPNGPLETKALVEDSSLFQPNDVAQSITGDIYYSDPDFKNRQRSAVYHLSPAGKITKIIEDLPLPNGVITSNDGKTLYVGDSHLKHWRAYPIQADGSVGPGILFFDPPTDRQDDPDGMSIDAEGNLYLTGRGGVWVADRFGNSLGLIAVPEFCSNVTFGGEDGRTLFLTCAKKVYRLQMKGRGAQFMGVK